MIARPEPLAGRSEALEDRIATLGIPQGKGWSNDARETALARLRAMGLPSRRDEYWRYTDPATLIAPMIPEAPFDQPDEVAFDPIERVRIVFVDGVFDPSVSDDLSAAGVEVELLAQAMAHDIHWARDVYGTLEAAGQTPVLRALATLNTVAAREGLVIRVTGKATRPLHIVYTRTATQGEAFIHHCIKLDPGAEVTVLESGTGAARLNTVMEVDVGQGARFHHVRLQGRDSGRRVASHIFTRVGKDSLFKSFTLSMNGAMTRNEVVMSINGPDAVAHVAGAAVGDGTGFHHDDTVFITHAGPGCESRQVFKKVLKNGATGVFQGKILVDRIAQKTDGYQINQSLMLDGDSQMLAKPELEIYADDVKCSHGSTSGAMDEEALFYLRSRGVPRAQAETLLVLSFLADAVAEIEDPAISADILARLEGWLIRHQR